MSLFQSKIKKAKDAEPTELENRVSQAVYELQQNSDKLKQSLRELYICGAKEFDSAYVVFVPVPQLSGWQKLIRERNLIEELEKKFSGKHVLVLAERRIIRKESRSSRQLKQLRPRSRTLTSVYESILDDMIFPVEIVGKRIRVKLDGARIYKIHLQPDHKPAADKLAVYTQVYKSITGRDIVFEFPH